MLVSKDQVSNQAGPEPLDSFGTVLIEDGAEAYKLTMDVEFLKHVQCDKVWRSSAVSGFLDH